jgi:hypothetical protein
MSVNPMMTQGTRPSTSFVDWLMRYVQMTDPDGTSPQAMSLLEMLQGNQSPTWMSPRIAPTRNQGFLDYMQNMSADRAQGENSLFDFIANYIRRNYTPGGQMTGGGASRMM